MTRPAPAVLLALLATAAPLAAQWRGSPLAGEGLTAGGHFGSAVAVKADGSRIAVGAHLWGPGGNRSGAVYLFEKAAQEGGWTQVRAFTGAPGDQLGFDLAFHGDALLIGAPFARTAGVACGAVYRLEEQDLGAAPGLTPVSDGDRLPLPPGACAAGAEIGSAVAAAGDVVAVGARGADRRAGRVYASFGTSALEPFPTTGLPAGAELGQALAIDGNLVAAGAPFGGTNLSGAVHLFLRQGNGWQERRVLPGRPQTNGAFGYAVALDTGRLVVGAPLTDVGGAADAGAASVFDRATLSELAVVQGAGARHQMGVAVAVSGRGVFAGARRAGAAGSGDVFEIGGGSRTSIGHGGLAKPGSGFGFAIAARGDVLAVGAFQEDTARGTDSGAAYAFEATAVVPPTGPGDPQVVTVSFAAGASEVAEGAGPATPLLLVTTSDGEPTAAAVTVEVAVCRPEDACTATAGSDYTWPVPPAAVPVVVTIPANTGDGAARPLVVPILDDAAGCEGGETLVVHLERPGQHALVGPENTHVVTIVDDDPGGFVLDVERLEPREGGATATGSLRLCSRPTAPVTVMLTSSNPANGIVAPPELVFSPLTWDVSQSFEVAAVDDASCEEGSEYSIRIESTSDDATYERLEHQLAVVNENDDRTCLSASKSVCVEPDATVVYTVEVSNDGLAALEDEDGHEMFDELPAAVAVASATADRGVATVDYVNNTVAWNGRVEQGSPVSITIVGVLEPVPADQIVSNVAVLTFDRDGRPPLETARPSAEFTAGDPPPCPAP